MGRGWGEDERRPRGETWEWALRRRKGTLWKGLRGKGKQLNWSVWKNEKNRRWRRIEERGEGENGQRGHGEEEVCHERKRDHALPSYSRKRKDYCE